MAKAKTASKSKKVIKSKAVAKIASQAPSMEQRLKSYEEKVYEETLAKVLNFLDKHEMQKEKVVSKVVEKLERAAAKKFASLFDETTKKPKKKRSKTSKAKQKGKSETATI